MRLTPTPTCQTAQNIVVLICTLQGANAQMVWRDVSPPQGPSGRWAHAVSFHKHQKKLILFGGGDSNGWSLADTWDYDGARWARVPIPAPLVPPGRSFHAMTYDEQRKVIVLFGGYSDTRGILNDTWEYDGTVWIPRLTASRPPPLYHHSLTYDSKRQVTVLFGGYKSLTQPNASSNETWEWNGTAWRQRSFFSSPHRHQHAMVFDAVRSKHVLFGGVDDLQVSRSDTWEWDGSAAGWQWRPVSTSPPPVWGRMAFDADRERVVWCGSRYLNAPTETWEWDGVAWSSTIPTVPLQRTHYGVTYDSSRNRVILTMGGYGGQWYGDTWSYQPSTRARRDDVGAGCAGSNGIPVLRAAAPPILGNTGFGALVTSGLPTSTVMLGIATNGLGAKLGACTLYLDFGASGPLLAANRTDRMGSARFSLPIPTTQALRGFRLHMQAFVVDPQGAYFRQLSFTQGLVIVVGD